MDYSLKPLGKTCAATGEPLQPGALCYSVLIENNGNYDRLDFSPEGWSGVPDGCLGVWRTEVPMPEAKPQGYLDIDSLFETFTGLVEQANDQERKLRYVIALLLIRKKRLQQEESFEREGKTWLSLTGMQGEGQFEIEEEQLSEFEIARLQAELQTISQGDKRQAA